MQKPRAPFSFMGSQSIPTGSYGGGRSLSPIARAPPRTSSGVSKASFLGGSTSAKLLSSTTTPSRVQPIQSGARSLTMTSGVLRRSPTMPSSLDPSRKMGSLNIGSGNMLQAIPARVIDTSGVQASPQPLQVVKTLSAPSRNLIAGGVVVQENQVSREDLLASGRLVELVVEGCKPAATFSRPPSKVAVAAEVIKAPELELAWAQQATNMILAEPPVLDQKDSIAAEVVQAAEAEQLARLELEQALEAQRLAAAEACGLSDQVVSSDTPTPAELYTYEPTAEGRAKEAERLAQLQVQQEAEVQRLAAAEAVSSEDAPSAELYTYEPQPVKGVAGRLARAGFAMN